jgi:hypothetical protein
VARIYDYFLGGKDNFAADREAAEQILTAYPDARIAARANRTFQTHAVWYLAAKLGIRQFLDIGTGIPTSPNVHEIAHQVDPEARTAYVDNDRYVLAHAGALLADNPQTIAVNGDLDDPWRLLTDPDLRGHLNFDQPIGLVTVAVWHFVGRDGAACESLKILRNQLAPGSAVAISHLLTGREDVEKARKVYDKANLPARSRTREQVLSLLDGWELIPPGLVHVSEWHAENEAELPTNIVGMYARPMLANVPLLCGIGRKV